MHIDTIQAIFLGVTATVSFVLNGYIAQDGANMMFYDSNSRPLWQMLAFLVFGILGALLGTGLSLLACHWFPGSIIASVVTIILVFPVSFILWLLVYLPDMLRSFGKLGHLT